MIADDKYYNNIEGPKDLIWVKKEVAEQYIKLAGQDEANRIIVVEAQRIHKAMKSDIDNMEEEVICFKAKCIKYKDAYKGAVDQIINETSPVWEKLEELNTRLHEKTKYMQEMITGVCKKAEELSTAAKHIDDSAAYKLKNIVEVVEKFNQLTERDREITRLILQFQLTKKV